MEKKVVMRCMIGGGKERCVYIGKGRNVILRKILSFIDEYIKFGDYRKGRFLVFCFG